LQAAEEKRGGRREIEEIGRAAVDEESEGGGYPIPGILQSVRKRLISKRLKETDA
jgi:hypothetical protein